MTDITAQITLPEETIISKILYVRKQKVMIDRDLAEMFGVTTKRLNEQVKRNIKRFPEHFMFVLTLEEKENVVAICDHLKKLKYSPHLPSVFTEYGIIMLSSVLNSERAIQASVRIVEIFIKMRELLLDNTDLRLSVEEIKKNTENNTKNIELVFSYLDELIEKQDNPQPRKEIGFKLPKKK